MEKQTIEHIFRKFSELKVLIIGDAMVDNYLWGTIDRISPEAPVPVVAVTRKENRLGGAANVCLNIQALGAKPLLVSVIGNDENGRIFSDLMRQHNLSTETIIADDSRPTTVKTRIISGGQQIVRVDQEVSLPIGKKFAENILSLIIDILNTQSIQVIIFADYDKGLITPELIQAVVKKAQTKNILTAADPKNRNFHHYQSVDLFKPNFKEFRDGLNLQIDKNDLTALMKEAEKFKSENAIGLLLVTLSELGILVTDGRIQSHFPSEIRAIADVSGAGDTVIATASLCMAAGLSESITAQLANLAGGLVCEKSGVVPIDPELLKKEANKIK